MRSVLVAVIALALVLGVAWYLLRDGSPPQEEQPASAPAQVASAGEPERTVEAPSRASPDGGAPLHLLRIRVMDDGRPAPDATVLLDGEPQLKLTDADGRWSIERSEAPAFVGARARTRAARPLALHGFPPGELVLALADSAALDGEVRSAVDGSPIAGAQVKLSAETATTDAEGHFAFPAAAPGEPNLTVHHEGFLELKSSLQLAPDAAQHLALQLEPAASVSGVVQQEGGAPVGGAAVVVHCTGRQTVITRTTTGDDGRFAVSDAVPGACDLEVDADGFAAAHQVLTVPRTDLEVLLHRGGELAGHVTDANGKPLAGVHLWLTAALDLFKGPKTDTDPSGAYQLSGITPGIYELHASLPGHVAPQELTLRIADEAYQKLDVKFPGGGKTVRGLVVDAVTGKPIARGSPRTRSPATAARSSSTTCPTA